jgi:hypothetical protein
MSKKIHVFAVLLMMLASFQGMAGIPDEDPVVAYVQATFSRAHTPATWELKLGRTWVCEWYTATGGVSKIVGPARAYRFNEFDGLIRNVGPWDMLTHLVYLNDSLVGAVKFSSDDRYFARVTGKGDLILELTTPETYFRDDYVPSTADPSRSLLAYVLCPSRQVR